MKFVVCVKQIYDVTAGFHVEAGRLRWGSDALPVINPWDEFAVEAALQQKERAAGEVIALSVGDEHAREAIKHAIAMGCDSGIWVKADDSSADDSQAVAALLAAAVQKIGGIEAVFFGKQASDSQMGVQAVQTARKMGWPVLTQVSKITAIDEKRRLLSAERWMEEGCQSVETQLPVVLSINKDFAEPRFPSFLGTRKAAKAVIPAWSPADLGIRPGAPLIHDQGVRLVDAQKRQIEWLEGASPDEIAAKLVDRLASEKIL